MSESETRSGCGDWFAVPLALPSRAHLKLRVALGKWHPSVYFDVSVNIRTLERGAELGMASSGEWWDWKLSYQESQSNSGNGLCWGEVDPYICPLWLWMSRSQPHPVSVGHVWYLDGAHGQQVRSLRVTDSNREATKAVWLGKKKKKSQRSPSLYPTVWETERDTAGKHAQTHTFGRSLDVKQISQISILFQPSHDTHMNQSSLVWHGRQTTRKSRESQIWRWSPAAAVLLCLWWVDNMLSLAPRMGHWVHKVWINTIITTDVLASAKIDGKWKQLNWLQIESLTLNQWQTHLEAIPGFIRSCTVASRSLRCLHERGRGTRAKQRDTQKVG